MLAHVDWWKLCALNSVVNTVEEKSNPCFLFSTLDFQVFTFSLQTNRAAYVAWVSVWMSVVDVCLDV